MTEFSLLMLQRCNLFSNLLLVGFLLFLSFGPAKSDDGKTVEASFNSHNQVVGKEGQKLAIFLGIVVRTPELTPLHANDWRIFDNGEKKKLLNFVRTENGIEPTRAQIFLLTHKKRKDDRPLDDNSAKIIYMISERISSERSTEQPPHSVSWECDMYSQVLGNDKSGYVHGLGHGPTASVLWGSKSSLGNIIAEDSSNEVVQRVEREIIELKDKKNQEMNLMKQNQEKMHSKLYQMRQLMCKYAPNESMPQNINDTSNE
ncbi:hypothetical protein HAX54_003737 [Datura stramonium]|uniref:Uncharacterized protein n=1 Tax=Datura stramonium TaxID=4076 RepID=A0ABS8WW52_DATST|nr:hypothetical protein [Datura stramonium]